MLCKLVVQDSEIHGNHHLVIVVFKKTDDTQLVLTKAGIEVCFLFGTFKNFFITCNRVYKFNPNVIQSWLYISDLISLFFKLFLPNSILIWNIRNGQPSRRIISIYSWISVWICSRMSFIPSSIICPSRTSIKNHIDFGFCKNKFVYIPNFVERIYNDAYSSENKDYLKNKTIIFGVVTRMDEQKGIDTLLKAIYQLPVGYNLRFHFIGSGMTKENIERKLQSLKIHKLFYEYCCLEKQNDLVDFYKNIDYHISPSRSEAFPNAVLESMFMGKPNIATNVGDSNILISDIGFLVSANDHDALAKAIIKCAKIYNDDFKEYLSLSLRSHLWIEASFSMEVVLKEYNRVWKN